MPRCLILEDDADIRSLIEHYLERDGWQCDAVGDGQQALQRLETQSYRLLILDLQVPGRDGLSVLRHVRATERLRALPVVIVTAKGDETDRVVGLEVGADDYIVKPFSPRELAARIRAILRRVDRPDAAEESVTRADVTLDRARHTVTVAGKAVHLTAKEFALLLALIDAKGRVLSRERLLEEHWGYNYSEGMRTIDVHVRRLREKLPSIAAAIRTVKPIGYRFSLDDEGP